MGDLVAGALFFGIRSCKCSLVTGERKNWLLTLWEIKFLKNNKKIVRTKANSHLIKADSVSIRFISQKNNKMVQKITMQKNGSSLCPVKIWAKIVLRILECPDNSLDIPVNTYKTKKDRINLLTSKEI